MAFRPPPRVFLNILAGGAVLRLATLSEHSLWLDEGATWSWATKATWAETLLAEANHPPVWWGITRLWIAIFGDSVWALRAPAALLGILTIWLCWRLGLRLFDGSAQPIRGGFARSADPAEGRRMAMWFAGFVAASTYFIEYAQEARMYALLLAESVGLSLLYLRWLDKRDKASLWGYALLAAFALYTQYFALWPIAAHAAHALWLGTRKSKDGHALRPWPFLAAVVGAGLLFVPWLLYMLANYEGISTGDPYEPFGRLGYVLWRIGAGPGLVVVDRPRLEEGIGAVVEEELLTISITALLWFVPLVLGAWCLRRAPGLRSFVAFQVLVPIALVLAVFPWFPLIHERYLLFLAPWLFLLVTYAAFRLGPVLKPILLTTTSGLLLFGLVGYFGVEPFLVPTSWGPRLGDQQVEGSFGPSPKHPLRALDHGHPFGKEPWREAHDFVEKHAAPGDLVLLHPWYLHLVWDYYDRHTLPRQLLPRGEVSPTEVLKAHGDALRKARRVFLILAHEETEDPDAYFRIVGAALISAWREDGLTELELVPPILFHRSWGVRVAIFNRR